MDEPTASLDARETAPAARDRPRARGCGHDDHPHLALPASEVLAARRHGHGAAGRAAREDGADAASETEASLIEAMLGRPLTATFPPKAAPPADAPVVSPCATCTGRGVEGVSFELRAGEIVGLAGLVGAGRTELARAIFGAAPSETGEAVLATGAQLARNPRRSLDAGVAMIPESRKDEGLIFGRSSIENVTLPQLHELSLLGVVRRRRGAEGGAQRARALRRARRELRRSGRARCPAATSRRCSSRACCSASRASLIADEPTRGVDVGAKRAIYDLLVELADGGHGDPAHLLRARGDPRPRPPRARHARGPHGGRARGRADHRDPRSSPRRSPTSLRKPLHDVRRLADAALDDARADALDGRALPPPRRDPHPVPRALPHALAGQRAVPDEGQPAQHPRPAVGDPDHRRGRDARARRRRDRPLGRRGLRVRRGHRRRTSRPTTAPASRSCSGSAPACSSGCSTASSSPSSGSTR